MQDDIPQQDPQSQPSGQPVEQAPDPAPAGTDANDNPPVPSEAAQDPSHSSPGTDSDVGQAQAEGATSESVSPEASDDVAPDADEPGDDTIDPDLQQHAHEGDVPQDEVDQEG